MQQQQRYIMGKNCIQEVLKADPSRIICVLTSQTSEEDPLYRQLLQQKIAVKKCSKQELTKLVSSDSHQSFIAIVREKKKETLEFWLKRFSTVEQALVVILDSIFDPQNLGAILRACECFGADLIIFSKNRGTDLTPAASKASVGASELVPLLKVSNLVETMKMFQKEDFWAIASEISSKAHNLYRFDFPKKALLILGSEGKGIQPLLSQKCDFHLYIPMYGKIDSLNVSQAAAVLLSAYRSHISID